MSYVQLADVKKFLEVIHSADDEVIQGCIDAAESYAASYMNRQAITDDQDCPWTNQDGCECDSEASSSEISSVVPAAVVQAIKFLAAEYYEHRIGGEVPKHVEQMLHMHRVGLGA